MVSQQSELSSNTTHTQAFKLLTMNRLLKSLIGKEVHALCKEHEKIIGGVLTTVSSKEIVLLTPKGEQSIRFVEVLGISSNETYDTLASIEETLVSDMTNQYSSLLGKTVFAISRYIPWCHCGVLVYIGKDYVSIQNQNLTYFHLPLPKVRHIATDCKKLKY